jgi:hypothetical protein
MLTHDGRRLQTNRAVTEGSALGATGYDANMLGHCVFTSPLYRISEISGKYLSAELTGRGDYIQPSIQLIKLRNTLPALETVLSDGWFGEKSDHDSAAALSGLTHRTLLMLFFTVSCLVS